MATEIPLRRAGKEAKRRRYPDVSLKEARKIGKRTIIPAASLRQLIEGGE